MRQKCSPWNEVWKTLSSACHHVFNNAAILQVLSLHVGNVGNVKSTIINRESLKQKLEKLEVNNIVGSSN